MADRFRRWMYGRYGVDRLCRHLIFLAIILLIVSMFRGRQVLYPLSLAFMLFAYFRAFSKNVPKRYKENMAYEKFIGRIKNMPKGLSQRRTHHIYRCPKCRQRIRIPRGKGRVEISCPKCMTRFIRKS